MAVSGRLKRTVASTYCHRMSDPLAIEPFTIAIEEELLVDLRRRIEQTRWPVAAPESGWVYGVDVDYLRALLRSWVDNFDWRASERELNLLPHYRATIEACVCTSSTSMDADPLLYR
jgi:hypothetical protein